jgi:putative hydrolase of the HAD superfamily
VNQPTFILFDMNGVLYRFDTALRLKLLARAVDMTPDQLQSLWLDSGWEDEADAGAYADGDAYLAAFGALVGQPVDRQAWSDIMAGALTPHTPVIALARRILRHLGSGLLTNNGPLLREQFAKVAPAIPRLFGAFAHCSADFRLRKPDGRVFQAYCARHALDPAQVLFIDDSPEHVEGARSIGMTGHHFTTAQALEDVLLSFQLITTD